MELIKILYKGLQQVEVYDKVNGSSYFLFFQLQWGFFLSVGALLFVYHQANPLPEGIKSDAIFATFIVDHFPTGIQGLMVAGVLAATMSALDSTINALCATLYNDILPKVQGNFHHLRNTGLISVGLLVVALIASQSMACCVGIENTILDGWNPLGIFLLTVILGFVNGCD